MIPTYNCAAYLRETLESVLIQDLGGEQMQIEVIDDCSTKDDPESVVREIGNGRVSFYRKTKNEGAVANFNTCIERSRGHLIHILHGDDWVNPGFYQEIKRLRELDPDLALYACRNFFVDEDGMITGVTARVRSLELGGHDASSFFESTGIQFCGTVVTRDFYEEHGGFLQSLVHTADCEAWIRAISIKGGIISPKVLASYRIFPTNDSGQLAQTAENIRDIQRLNAILATRFPGFNRKRASLRAAFLARDQALRFERMGKHEAARANWVMWEALAPSWIRFKGALRRWIRLACP